MEKERQVIPWHSVPGRQRMFMCLSNDRIPIPCLHGEKSQFGNIHKSGPISYYQIKWSTPPHSCCLMGHTSQVPLHEALTREQIQQAPGTGHFCWRQLRVLLLTVFFPSVDPCGYLIRTSSLNFTRGGFCDLQTKIGTDTKNHHTHHETSILCNIASLSEVFPQNIFKDMGNNTETCVDQNPINQLAST